MKAFLSLLFTLTVAAGGVFAQDRIVRTDGSEIEAKVTEISPDEVRYKRFSNPDGPTYVLPSAQIRRIVYPNGEEDVFGEAAEMPPAADAAAVPAEAAVPADPERAARSSEMLSDGYVLRTYAVGDWYERGEVRGVVCALSDDKLHGLILSADEIYLPWSTFRKPDLRAVGAADTADGAVNMRILEQYIEENGLSWDDFPAFAWCRAKGDGWYLPAIDEMLLICANYNGGSRMANNRAARNRFNDSLRENGGKRMDRLVFYYSSTERDAKSVLCTHTALEPPYVQEIPKSDKFLVRAVHKF